MRSQRRLLHRLWSKPAIRVNSDVTNENLEQLQIKLDDIYQDKSLLTSVSSRLLGHELMELGEDFLYLGALYELKYQQMMSDTTLFDSFYLAFKFIRSGLFRFNHKLKQSIKSVYKKFNSESYVHFFIEKQFKLSA